MALILAPQGSALAVAAPPPIERLFRIADDKNFAAAEAVLKALVARKGKAPVNHFCAIGQSLSGGDRQAWVYWREGRAIILWEPTDAGNADLATSRRYLVYGRDIVRATDARLATSSYLVTTAWADALVSQCRESGTNFVIARGKR